MGWRKKFTVRYIMVAIINIPSPLYLSLCPGKACLASPSGCLLLPSHPAPWGEGGTWGCGHMLGGKGELVLTTAHRASPLAPGGSW